MASIFVYGTLMCKDIFQSVSRTLPRAQKATLKGYRRFAIKNEYYPGVIEQKGFDVEGLVYDEVPEQSWVLLDSFEGDMYERKEVKVHLENGENVDAFVYVIKPEYTHLMGANDWSFERFVRSGKTQFEEGYRGFHCLDQKGKVDHPE